MTRRALMLLALAIAGCRPDSLLPDRAGLGATIDADNGSIRTYQANLYWNLHAASR